MKQADASTPRHPRTRAGFRAFLAEQRAKYPLPVQDKPTDTAPRGVQQSQASD